MATEGLLHKLQRGVGVVESTFFHDCAVDDGRGEVEAARVRVCRPVARRHGVDGLLDFSLVVTQLEAVEDGNRIVGFYVEPFSILHTFPEGYEYDPKASTYVQPETCGGSRPMDLDLANQAFKPCNLPL